jgi:predicted GTPase
LAFLVQTPDYIAEGDVYEPHVREQAISALRTADVLMMVVDVSDGVIASDHDVAQLLRFAPNLEWLAVDVQV